MTHPFVKATMYNIPPGVSFTAESMKKYPKIEVEGIYEIPDTPWEIRQTYNPDNSNHYRICLIVNDLKEELKWCKEPLNFSTFYGTFDECIEFYNKIKK